MAFEAGNSNAGNDVTCKMTTGKEVHALIVDDDSMAHVIHKCLLSGFGFKTVIVENGKQAVELFETGSHFDLITMDFHMPIMDGLEVSCLIKFNTSFLE